jgi:hypothetical protein
MNGMIMIRKSKKRILILTGLLFLVVPTFDYYIVLNKEPIIFWYIIAVIVGICFIVYGLRNK